MFNAEHLPVHFAPHKTQNCSFKYDPLAFIVIIIFLPKLTKATPSSLLMPQSTQRWDRQYIVFHCHLISYSEAFSTLLGWNARKHLTGSSWKAQIWRFYPKEIICTKFITLFLITKRRPKYPLWDSGGTNVYTKHWLIMLVKFLQKCQWRAGIESKWVLWDSPMLSLKRPQCDHWGLVQRLFRRAEERQEKLIRLNKMTLLIVRTTLKNLEVITTFVNVHRDG